MLVIAWPGCMNCNYLKQTPTPRETVGLKPKLSAMRNGSALLPARWVKMNPLISLHHRNGLAQPRGFNIKHLPLQTDLLHAICVRFEPGLLPHNLAIDPCSFSELAFLPEYAPNLSTLEIKAGPPFYESRTTKFHR
jgi:hypothetical protein